MELFAAFGFEPNASSSFERGLEKVALYADDGVFTHVAVQADEGWSSKCGELHDISHRLLGDLEDDFYGRVVAILGRQTLSPRG